MRFKSGIVGYRSGKINACLSEQMWFRENIIEVKDIFNFPHEASSFESFCKAQGRR